MTEALIKVSLAGVAVVGAGMLAIMSPFNDPSHKTNATGGSSVEIVLKLANTAVTVGEDLSMVVSVTNRTSSAVEIPDPFHRDNWQPVYTITGPSYPQGHSFTFRSAVLKETALVPEDVVPKLITLASGETVETDVPLHAWAPVKEPGDYEVTASLLWPGVAAQAKPVRFTVQRSNAHSASVGVDFEVQASPGEWVEWFQKESAGQRLYSALFQRPQVDVRGYKPFSVDAIFTAAPNATDLLSPWTTFNRMLNLTKWRVWREGASLVALATGLPKPQRLDLGGEPALLVRPALMSPVGELEVLFASAGSKSELALARFPAPDFKNTAQQAASVLWRAGLAARPVAARAAVSSQNDRYVVVFTQQDSAVAVHYLNVGAAASKAGNWVTVNMPGAFVFPDSEPALRIDSDGSAKASIILMTNPDKHQVSIVDLSFDRGGRAGTPVITAIGSFSDAPRAAAAAYPIMGGAEGRRDWVLLLKDGTFRHSADQGKPQPMNVSPAMPLQLIGHADATYLLAVDAAGKPAFKLMD